LSGPLLSSSSIGGRANTEESSTESLADVDTE
jgi:hypothetical protein